MLRSLFTRKTVFFDLFEQHAAIILQAAREFLLSLSNEHPLIAMSRIKSLEHQADIIASQCIEMLHKTFITPIDRDQTYQLICRMDDIIDSIDAAADDFLIYKIHAISPDFLALAKITVDAAREVQKGVFELRRLKHNQSIRHICHEIRRLENEADNTLREALGRLFDDEPDARQIIKWKDLYESLENASDRCADVADVIEGILLESD